MTCAVGLSSVHSYLLVLMQLLLRHADWTSPFWSRDGRPRDHSVGGAGRDALRPGTVA